jgi:HIV Tat-specific factor 1
VCVCASCAGWVACGQLSGATLAWHEGAPEWTPLERLLPPPEPARAAASLARGAVRAAAPSAAPPTRATAEDNADAQLRSWQAEVARLEAAGGAAAADARPESPECAPLSARMRLPRASALRCVFLTRCAALAARFCRREKSFVDDDGTTYVWDGTRFAPQPDGVGGAAGGGDSGAGAAPQYGLEEMVFPDEEEAPLPKPPPTRAAAAAREGLDSDEDADAAAAAVAAAGADADAVLDEEDAEDGDPGKKTRAAAVARERARLKARSEKAAAAKSDAPKVNTSVYVTGLPDDATPAEVAEVFGRCGLIKEDEDGAPRVKIYRDKASGVPKGDGLVIYLKARKHPPKRYQPHARFLTYICCVTAGAVCGAGVYHSGRRVLPGGRGRADARHARHVRAESESAWGAPRSAAHTHARIHACAERALSSPAGGWWWCEEAQGACRRRRLQEAQGWRRRRRRRQVARLGRLR